ncbi:MAG: right-handed parallel beta-helix repeat-containing protein [Anaerolineae bacterium]
MLARRLTLLLSIALAVCLMSAASASATATLIVVTTTDDVDGSACNPAICSLRQAINQANAADSAATIAFNIQSDSVPVIEVGQGNLGPLPALTKPITLDGTSQPGGQVVLNGAAAGADAVGLRVSGGSSTVRGLTVYAFGGAGLEMTGGGDNVVRGNTFYNNGGDGILVLDSPRNTIGGASPDARNIIFGNAMNGVEIRGGDAISNVVAGNAIGTDGAGIAGMGNMGVGVAIVNARNTTVGGDPASRNIISGNRQQGVLVFGLGASGNTITNNYIGTDPRGQAALSNGAEGVSIHDASTTVVGGSGAGNVIGGNGGSGIHIFGDGSANVVTGNLIGVTKDGVRPLPNGGGVVIEGSPRNKIGGPEGGAGNVIAFNRGLGVSVDGGIRNTIRGNSIYRNTDGGIELKNGGNGGQTAPTITSAQSDSVLLVSGTLFTTPATTFAIDVYTTASCSSSDALPVQTYRGAGEITTDGQGYASFSLTLPSTGDLGIVATATDADGNTSTFSSCVTATRLPLAVIRGKVQMQGRSDFSGVTVGDGTAVTTTKPDGTFVLTVEPGIRTVTARHAGYLSAQAVITAETAITLPTTLLLGGDANNNGLVGLDDLVLVDSNYDLSPPLNPAADVNGDGVVDLLDVTLVAINYGARGPTTWGAPPPYRAASGPLGKGERGGVTVAAPAKVTAGQEFAVTVRVPGGAVGAAEIRVRFDPAQLSLVEDEKGRGGDKLARAGTFVSGAHGNPTQGDARYVAAWPSGADGATLTLRFRAKSDGAPALKATAKYGSATFDVAPTSVGSSK